MKRNSVGKGLPVLTLGLGMAAFLLRVLLYGMAVDVKGLLLRHHPLEIALTVLTVLVLLAVAAAARLMNPGPRKESASLAAAFGTVAAASGILTTVLTTNPGMGGYLAIAWRYLGLAAPVCLLLAGFARALGKRPGFLLYVVACLFFVLHIVTRYQMWSGNPQMQDYVFSLLGAMALMFFGFYRAAWYADCGSLRMSAGTGLAAIYLCTAELARSSCPVLYLGGILWVLTELCSLFNSPVSEETE